MNLFLFILGELYIEKEFLFSARDGPTWDRQQMMEYVEHYGDTPVNPSIVRVAPSNEDEQMPEVIVAKEREIDEISFNLSSVESQDPLYSSHLFTRNLFEGNFGFVCLFFHFVQ